MNAPAIPRVAHCSHANPAGTAESTLASTIPPMTTRRPIAVPSPSSAQSPGELPESVLRPTSMIDASLREYVSGIPLPPSLREAMLYSLLGPGKRMRPLLAWHCYAAISPEGSDASPCLPAAGAVEMVHAFSLVHDDLPGLDNDDLRRGRPTLHKHAGEAMAVLAGDSLLTSAFQLISDRVPSLALQARLTQELATATNGMIAGQIYDTLGGFPESLSGVERLELIHRHKTGMLIRCACRMGGLCALEEHPGAGRFDALGAVTHYAEAIGLMFQIVDDVLDVTQSTEQLGKKAGKDEDAGKLTYPVVLGLDRSRQEIRRLHEASLVAIEPLGEAAEPLRQLSTYMAVRTK